MVLYKKDVLKKFTKFTGKHLHLGLFFNKVEGLKKRLITSIEAYNFNNNRLCHSHIPATFSRFSKSCFLQMALI